MIADQLLFLFVVLQGDGLGLAVLVLIVDALAVRVGDAGQLVAAGIAVLGTLDVGLAVDA